MEARGRVDPIVEFELSDAPPSGSRRRQFPRARHLRLRGRVCTLSTYGIWSALSPSGRHAPPPRVSGFSRGVRDGLRVVHLSDLHAGMHLGEDRIQESSHRSNAPGDQTSSCSGGHDRYLSEYSALPYARVSRPVAPLGGFTVLGNHDHYTGRCRGARVRDAGQILGDNGCEIIERDGARGLRCWDRDPDNWKADDPRGPSSIRALPTRPPEAFRSS